MKKIIALVFALFFATDAIAEGEGATFKFEWNDDFGEMDQAIDAGSTITPILFDYEGITAWDVTGLPPEFVWDIDAQFIIISGPETAIESGNYEYTVTVTDSNSQEHTLSGVITVNGKQDGTEIKVIENEKQKVTAGDNIKPIAFKFEYVTVTENLENFKIETTLPASLNIGVEEDVMTINGTVDEETLDGSFTIKVVAKGKVNNDTAFATVDVVHKPRVTSIETTENATQTVTAGQPIQPIVFKIENVDDKELTGFPGSYNIVTDKENKTMTVTGTLNENTKGSYTITLSVKGLDNNASAKATINVTPVDLKFELVEGNDNQSVIAGNAIHTIIYQYDHMLSASGSGFPAGLTMTQDVEKKQIRISGTVNSELTAFGYDYSFAVKNVYGEDSTVTGKINVVSRVEDYPSVHIYKHNGGTLLELNADYSGKETLSIPAPIVVDSIDFKRALTPLTPATTVLPFSLPEGTTLNADFYYVQKVEQVGCSWNATMKYIGTGNLPNANTPYAFILNEGESNLRFDMHGKQATVETDKIADIPDETGNWYFKGLYSYRVWKDDDDEENNEIGLAYGFAGSNEHGIAKGEFGRVEDGAFAVPMTSYLRKANAQVRLNCQDAPSSNGAKYASLASIDADVITVRFVEDDENGEEKTTAIGRLDSFTGEIKIDRWYDLKGRRVNRINRAAKGSYYGKKVLKK